MAADVVVSSIKSFPDATSLALVSDLQFNEPYSSAALNRKFRGIVNTGFYGGFLPSPAGGLNLKISSGEEGGTASIDIDKYYQLTVRQQADVTLPVTAGKKVIVVLEATYALGQETYQVNCKSAVQAVEIKFLEEGTALRQNQLELCTVTVPAGATELTEEMIDVSRRRNQTVGITLSSEIDSDADHIAASSHAVKKAVKAARDETEKQIEELVDNAPASLDTLKKIADAINNDPDFFNTLNAVLALKAPLNDPAFTGIVTVPTPPLSVINQQVANTEFVHAAVAALVGSSPEALDTLAELAQALGNDPNFATTMLNALSGKQPLNQILTSLSGLNSAANKLAFFNGPNSMALANLTAVGRVLIGQETVAKVLEYLGLVETINRAAGSLQKDQNGADVPQPDWFVRNIGAARAFNGGINIGGGGEWWTPDLISWLENQGAFNHPYWMCKGSWSYANNRIITDTGCGNIQLAGAVVEVMGVRGAMTIRVTTATAGAGTLSTQFTYTNHGDDYSPGWRRDFSTANKPTSEDVGALPITGGTVSGNLGATGIVQAGSSKKFALSSVNTAAKNADFNLWGNAERPVVIEMRDDSGWHFYSQRNTDGSITFAVNGQVTPFNYGNFDARYQLKDNYATQAWVSQNFVQNIRQSGVGYIDAEKNSGQRLVPAGGVLIGSQVNGEWDNNEGFYYTWIQQNINGNWLTIGRV
ncbi:phage tail protein [Citrobacter sp. W5]|uniref:phage tail protein n=3 Tax=Citrobacter TaxID=544 RepID=UPI00227C49E0|nr:phage tail protein [Citrobacter sp. W5]